MFDFRAKSGRVSPRPTLKTFNWHFLPLVLVPTLWKMYWLWDRGPRCWREDPKFVPLEQKQKKGDWVSQQSNKVPPSQSRCGGPLGRPGPHRRAIRWIPKGNSEQWKRSDFFGNFENCQNNPIHCKITADKYINRWHFTPGKYALGSQLPVCCFWSDSTGILHIWELSDCSAIVFVSCDVYGP